MAEAGADIAVVGRTRPALEQTAQELAEVGVRVLVHAIDVALPGAAEKVIRSAEAELGPVDILVNNAGVLCLGAIETVNSDYWWHAFEVNLRAPMRWTQEVLTGMISRGRGLIINVSSAAANWTVPNASAYCASKAALTRMTAILDAEVRSRGVLSFAFSPRAATDMTEELGTSSDFTEQQRQMFKSASAVDVDGKLSRTVDLFRRVVSGELDHLSGRHLESEEPPPRASS